MPNVAAARRTTIVYEETALAGYLRIVLFLVIFAVLFYWFYILDPEETQGERIQRAIATEKLNVNRKMPLP